jgi:hypothetical protein
MVEYIWNYSRVPQTFLLYALFLDFLTNMKFWTFPSQSCPPFFDKPVIFMIET